jgi:hypothetical protein
MATTRQVLQSLCTLVQAGPTGGSALPAPPNLSLAVGWPPEDAIMSVPKTQQAVAGIFDAGPAPKDRTRWHQIPAVPDANVSPTTTATLSGSGFLLLGGTATVTIGGTPQAADAIGVQVNNRAATYVVLGSDTVDTIATALAAAINAVSGPALAVMASAAGAVVTLTAIGSALVSVATSNTGTRTTEYHRVNRFVRIILFAPFEDPSDGPNSREAIGDPIDLTLAQLESTFGFQVPNGEWVRLMYDDDLYVEQQLKDIYRRDFMTRLEYGVTGTETVYPVLGTNSSLQGGY